MNLWPDTTMQRKDLKSVDEGRLHWRQCQPMPLHEKNKKGIVFIALYIDDNLSIGNPEAKDRLWNCFQRTS